MFRNPCILASFRVNCSVTWCHRHFKERSSSSFEMFATSILTWSHIFIDFFQDWCHIFECWSTSWLIHLQDWCLVIFMKHSKIHPNQLKLDIWDDACRSGMFILRGEISQLNQIVFWRGEEFRNSLKARPLALRCEMGRGRDVETKGVLYWIYPPNSG